MTGSIWYVQCITGFQFWYVVWRLGLCLCFWLDTVPKMQWV